MLDEMTVQAAGENFGCFIDGIDLATASNRQIEECRALLFKHGALFIRDQNLTPERQIAIAEAMGEIVVNRYFTPYPGHPQIAQVLTEPDQEWVIGETWHTDHSYDVVPALGSILYAQEIPKTGGDTCFAGMHAAYDALTPQMKERVEGLQARHECVHVFAPSEVERLTEARARNDTAYLERANAYPEAIHSVVLEHPETGRKGLYVNPEFTTGIVGMDKDASDALLASLYAHILQPQFMFRYQWEVGSLAIWDNRSVWHQAMNDYRGERRLMRRITLAGVPLDGSGEVKKEGQIAA